VEKNALISRRSAGSAVMILALCAAAGCVPDGGAIRDSPPLAVEPEARKTEPVSPAVRPLPPVLSFEEAVDSAAHAVFTAAPAANEHIDVVIDPLIDGVTGYQSKATRNIQDRITALVKRDFPAYSVQRITPASLKKQPRVLIGTFTPVNALGKSSGQRESFWFCLVLLDLKSAKVIAKSVARVRMGDPDATPTSAFDDSPVWTDDVQLRAYVAACQGSSVDDPIKPEYLAGLYAAALISEAGDAYDERRYAEALDLYSTARKLPAGDQLRVYNGIYLSLTKLKRTDQAVAAFRDLVNYGLRNRRLAVKFLFRPGSVRFVSDTSISATYGMWLQQIATLAALGPVCLQITGHTSPTGPAAMNESLSLLRAEYVQSQLESDEPRLKKRTVAAGIGSRENLIGTGRDDATDMLDRRVELKPIEPCG